VRICGRWISSNFFVPPVPLDAVAYSRLWCGMGTLREVSDSILGPGACYFREANNAAARGD
jgi:hypothetical protein